MNRRNFFRTMIGGVAATAAVRTWPFRVYSFPSTIKIRDSWAAREFYSGQQYLVWNERTEQWEPPILRVPFVRLRQSVSQFNVDGGNLGRDTVSIYDSMNVFSQKELDDLVRTHGANQPVGWHEEVAKQRRILPHERISRSSQPFESFSLKT